MKVLLVEDEKTLALEVELFLKKSFYLIDLAHTAKKALEFLDSNAYDFVLLDLGLPDMDGLKLLLEAKKYNPDAAYIILTARGNTEDRIKGLDLGADDYLPKPFSLPELHSRMQAISRRKYGLINSEVSIGEFMVDLQKRTITHEQTAIELSKKEFDLLSYLLLHKNRPLTRMQLCEHIWGNFIEDENDSNYIDAHVKNLRKKLGAFASTEWLETIRGVGYKIKKQA
ncbi:Two-component response regulator [Arcticibacter svalbardensis MN12-7]|uniref:Two-component response regulator n=1 Tax=Arcticibacter svalbardensis MN12-7 TaxID=1150600 RepID=R9H3M4_9SPHI|nr:response regulator transcription factor [Arcticibacter svalbardensis]EOR95784.1 Two-component response regulator [Arcticibacter svalbardensis MN12-7]